MGALLDGLGKGGNRVPGGGQGTAAPLVAYGEQKLPPEKPAEKLYQSILLHHKKDFALHRQEGPLNLLLSYCLL